MQASDLENVIRQKVAEAMRERGSANILIAGRSGVGKSTLINAVFEGELAATGMGRPITEGIEEHHKPGIPITLIDTRGLELADFQNTLRALEELVASRRSDHDPHRHVHCGWVCISEDSRRVEEGEAELVSMLTRAGVPVIVVITKARADQGFAEEVVKLLPAARAVVRVRAIAEVLDEGMQLSPMGLVELVQETSRVLPEGHKTAFAAAQKVQLDLKVERARKVMVASAAAAAAAGATPIPVADAFVLVPIQVGMLASISAAFGLQVDKAFLGTLLSTLTGSLGAMVAGRAIVSSLLKLSGFGTVAGTVIAAATASTLTTTLGEIYIRVLTRLSQSAGQQAHPTQAQIIDALESEIDAQSQD